MNIANAKKQIKNAMRAYFEKNEYGSYVIPPQAQRPVFLMGAPGIGKTAIMAEIAQELGVGLLSYSMTHHTRQSTLGLPLITKKSYGGREYSTTEYTMSEIIASVYDMIEADIPEGILFLDEINCVSETLTPTMLQFLQYKSFGKHQLPGGWIVVTAGNPPEYNRNAHEFDIVTWDRLKRIDIEPDYAAWRAYAVEIGVHPAVISYLDLRKDHFYLIDNNAEGICFVTARAWTDLSDMIKLYERLGIEIDKDFTAQYLQSREVSEKFEEYYELFNKYKSDYKIDSILSGSAEEEIKTRARLAAFDERLSLLGMLIDRVSAKVSLCVRREDILKNLLGILKEVKQGAALESETEKYENEYNRAIRRGVNSIYIRERYEANLSFLKAHAGKDFAEIKRDYDAQIAEIKALSLEAGNELGNLFRFCEEVWGEEYSEGGISGQELLILVSELTMNPFTASFISRHGCEEYYKHNKELMFYQRQKEIITALETLEPEL